MDKNGLNGGRMPENDEQEDDITDEELEYLSTDPDAIFGIDESSYMVLSKSIRGYQRMVTLVHVDRDDVATDVMTFNIGEFMDCIEQLVGWLNENDKS